MRRNTRKAALTSLIPARLIVVTALCFTLVLSSCKTMPEEKQTVTVDEAKEIALEFKGKYKIPPPRGFGSYIDLFVKRYATIDPSVLAKCSKPREKLTDKEIKELAAGFSYDFAPAMLMLLASEEFLHGDTGTALKMIDHTWRIGENRNWRNIIANSRAEKAVMLADVGDYKAAGKLVLDARGAAGKWYSSSRNAKGWNKARTQYMIARAQAMMDYASGDLQAAEMNMYRALKILSRDDLIFAFHAKSSLWRVPDAKLRMGRILLNQGRLPEAEIWIREAIFDADDEFRPYCFVVLSEIFLAQGRPADAILIARTALNSMIHRCLPADALIRAKARETLAIALCVSGKWNEALAEFKAIENEMKTDPETYNRRFRGSADWGLTLFMLGDAKAAMGQLELALTQTQRRLGSKHYDILELKALMAMAMSALGRFDEALNIYAKVLPGLMEKWLARDVEIGAQGVRKHRFQLIIESYIKLLHEAGKKQEIEDAFVFSDLLRTRSVSKAIASSAARSAVSDPELAELIRQRQDLEVQLAARQSLLNNIMQQPLELQNNEVKEKHNSEIDRLRLAVKALDEEVKARFPRYASITNPDVIRISQIRNLLEEKDAFVSFFSGTNNTFVWAFTKRGIVAFAVVPLGRKALAETVAKLRSHLDPENVFTLGDLSRFDVDLGYGLYSKILEPVEKGWKQAKRLLVVADGPLGQLPLSLLPTSPIDPLAENDFLFAGYRQVPWLARTHAVTMLPSAATLITLSFLPEGNRERKAFAGFGDPFFSPDQLAHAGRTEAKETFVIASRGATFQYRGIRVANGKTPDSKKSASVTIEKLNRLPDTREEIESIAEAMNADPTSDIFLGKRASESNVKATNLQNRRIIAFATHALVPGELDGLYQPAIALSAPSVTGDDDDGLLTMGEVMGLRLDADWVVLSACNTAAGEGAGSEAVSGLGQAFFYAGAQALLVTSWPVETTSAKALTTGLFNRLTQNPELGRAEALRQTMIALIDGPGGKGFSYAHPIFWAPFIIVGAGG